MDPMERMNKILASSEKEQQVLGPYRARPGDVVIAGPPKTGTTWLQQILHQIRTKGDENFEDIYDVTWWLPVYHNPTYTLDMNAEQVAKPRVFKCHDNYEIIPKCEGMKFISVIRDPYDCHWSFVKFFYRFFGAEEDMEESAALEQFQKISDYYGNLISWYARRDDPNVLWLHYEDLKTDLKFCIAKIAEFIQIPLTEEELSRVHGFCTFEYMSTHDKHFSGEIMMQNAARMIESDTWKINCAMVRKDGGRVGEGRQNIGPKLKQVIAQRWGETVEKELGFKDYDALLQEASFLKKHGRGVSK